jgi:hypothetical protein
MRQDRSPAHAIFRLEAAALRSSDGSTRPTPTAPLPRCSVRRHIARMSSHEPRFPETSRPLPIALALPLGVTRSADPALPDPPVPGAGWRAPGLLLGTDWLLAHEDEAGQRPGRRGRARLSSLLLLAVEDAPRGHRIPARPGRKLDPLGVQRIRHGRPGGALVAQRGDAGDHLLLGLLESADALNGRRRPGQPPARRRDTVPLKLARNRTQRPATSTVDTNARGSVRRLFMRRRPRPG